MRFGLPMMKYKIEPKIGKSNTMSTQMSLSLSGNLCFIILIKAKTGSSKKNNMRTIHISITKPGSIKVMIFCLKVDLLLHLGVL